MIEQFGVDPVNHLGVLATSLLVNIVGCLAIPRHRVSLLSFLERNDSLY